MSLGEELRVIWKIISQSTNIPVLLLAGAISMVGAGLLNPIFPIYIKDQGISFIGLGAIFSVASGFSLLFKPVVGHISDVYGRKKLIVGFSFLVSLMTPLYVIVRNVVGFALVHSSRTLLNDSAQPAYSAMLGDVAPKDGRATLYGVYSSIQSLMYVVFLFAGGGILAWGLKLESLFYVTTVCFLVSSFILALFLKETVTAERAPAPGEESRFQRFIAGVRVMATERSSLGLMLYAFFFHFALAVYFVYIPLFVTEEFGVGPMYAGPIVAVSWITYAVVLPFGGRLSDKLGKRKFFILLGLVMIVFFNFAMAISSTLVWVVVFWALIGVGDGMFRPVMSALIVDIVPPTKRGAYFGTVGSVGGIANTLAPLVYGTVAELYSIRWSFLITSVFYALAMISVAVLIKEGKVIGEEE